MFQTFDSKCQVGILHQSDHDKCDALQTQNICIAFVQRWADVVHLLYNFFVLLDGYRGLLWGQASVSFGRVRHLLSHAVHPLHSVTCYPASGAGRRICLAPAELATRPPLRSTFDHHSSDQCTAKFYQSKKHQEHPEAMSSYLCTVARRGIEIR